MKKKVKGPTLQMIIEYRKKRGLTQKEVAAGIRMSLSAYYQLETGYTRLTGERVLQLVELLNINMQEAIK